MINNNLPKHIAIIMDGNGRWAKRRGLSRIRGHVRGVDSIREITTACAKRHIEQLTLYAFSKENWSRPRYEVEILMRLLKRYLIRERPTILDNNIRFTAIGQIEGLPKDVQKEIAINKEESKSNTGMVLCLALNYGGRAEIVDAARGIVADALDGKVSLSDIDEEVFKRHMYTSNMSDPDLLIRTGGDMRVSNFLLWEISYAELWVTPVCWPDFRKENLEEAIRDYSARERRYGGLIE
ncbi:MAG: di-trans,poly-cis-decaprenylcistransferase [Planctomycetes bacterium RIFCSPHIGHO2_02_FULL_50_42]|uniref:isoprenyl transferase n=1 Tax=Candidatus Avalokitesvara rifleensis TaxID=3367620 RepID=UPI0008D3B10D|nr:isoprenyl transferase [Candidatus Brocadiales bacterium]OHB36901.1 MAG: di-trans,poly-cis-decaprenylcistransferase [Planctomycetes bacterium GWA2_50_13]OHB87329.1 MAG: di-trans,poly-cis-decaprenylcistransferase [Planctomycetes bacterium RIFCSPHIGHO2_02_FULL_50_42]OHB96574.1 MAG: di-trans,poly-cis-decaprenylcistransferase [Planctomycetes bacterium RIFCSPLOWO2_02_FULL_50_16]OHC05005.1 MAG: di-trans,poly-cis-decaprenylcistransferase [Planctomycetes bacterium RIFCSPLOWO2_12_FULL_50_35]HCN18721.